MNLAASTTSTKGDAASIETENHISFIVTSATHEDFAALGRPRSGKSTRSETLHASAKDPHPSGSRKQHQESNRHGTHKKASYNKSITYKTPSDDAHFSSEDLENKRLQRALLPTRVHKFKHAHLDCPTTTLKTHHLDDRTLSLHK